MAIIKRANGSYQVKLRGSDGRWTTDTFATKKDAESHEWKMKQQKRDGVLVSSRASHLSVSEFFENWAEAVAQQASPGWRAEQKMFFKLHVQPVIGEKKLKAVTPALIVEVLRRMAEEGKSEQTQVHIYNLMRKMFRDAIELFQLLTFNPILKNLKPKIPLRETAHLNLTQTKALLEYVVDREYGLAIWIQLFMGLRVSELVALKWSDIDLERGLLTVQRSFSRKTSWITGEKVFKDYPKGRKQHSHQIPQELWHRLKAARGNGISEFVAATQWKGKMLSYEHYLKTLKSYCREAKVPAIGTHGLRHSTSELYMSHGATRDDLRELFAHSSLDITDRYVHGKGTNLERVTNVIRMFPKCSHGENREKSRQSGE
jgi:integrase